MYTITIVEAGNDWAQTIEELADKRADSIQEAAAYVASLGYTLCDDYEPQIEDNGEYETINVFVEPEAAR